MPRINPPKKSAASLHIAQSKHRHRLCFHPLLKDRLHLLQSPCLPKFSHHRSRSTKQTYTCSKCKLSHPAMSRTLCRCFSACSSTSPAMKHRKRQQLPLRHHGNKGNAGKYADTLHLENEGRRHSKSTGATEPRHSEQTLPQSTHSAATELAWRCYRALLPSMLIIVLHRNRVGSTCLSHKNCYRAFASSG